MKIHLLNDEFLCNVFLYVGMFFVFLCIFERVSFVDFGVFCFSL